MLDLDHTVDPTHGQQAFSFYNHHYRTHCFLPLVIFETGNNRLYEQARPYLDASAEQHTARCAEARRMGVTPPQATRSYHELSYAAGSWPIAPRVIVKAEVMAAGRNPRFVVTSLQHPEPEPLYTELCSPGPSPAP